MPVSRRSYHLPAADWWFPGACRACGRVPRSRPPCAPCLQLLAVVRRVRKFNSDLPALLDEWASSLFREVRLGPRAVWLLLRLLAPLGRFLSASTVAGCGVLDAPAAFSSARLSCNRTTRPASCPRRSLTTDRKLPTACASSSCMATWRWEGRGRVGQGACTCTSGELWQIWNACPCTLLAGSAGCSCSRALPECASRVATAAAGHLRAAHAHRALHAQGGDASGDARTCSFLVAVQPCPFAELHAGQLQSCAPAATQPGRRTVLQFVSMGAGEACPF